MLKKVIVIGMTLALALFMFTGCGINNDDTDLSAHGTHYYCDENGNITVELTEQVLRDMYIDEQLEEQREETQMTVDDVRNFMHMVNKVME